MNTQNSIDWDDFLADQLQDLNLAYGMLEEAVLDPGPPGYMARRIRQVLAVHPRVAPVVLSRYGHLVSQTELADLSKNFETVNSFVNQFSKDLDAVRAV